MRIPEALFSQILQVMPIPCVDILVVNEKGDVLLVLRRNEPAAGQWWFPGGRVLFGELRCDAAKRKLEEECGISSTHFQEIGTFDIFCDVGADKRFHSITTLYVVKVEAAREIRLDHQSSDARWLPLQRWLSHQLHPFVYRRLEEHNKS